MTDGHSSFYTLYGGLEILGKRLSVGELIAFTSYLGFMLQPILTLGFLAAGLTRAGASAVRVYEVLDAPLEVSSKPGAMVLPTLEGRVEFRDVKFRYVGSEREIALAMLAELAVGVKEQQLIGWLQQ